MNEIINVFGINGKLLIIQAFNFAILLVILWHFLYKPVVRMLEKRQGMIEKGVRDSEKATAQLAEISEEKESIVTAATVDADIIVERAKKRGEEKEAVIVEEAKQKSERILEEAAMKAQEEKRRALSESKEEIAHMAVLSAEKILREKIQ